MLELPKINQDYRPKLLLSPNYNEQSQHEFTQMSPKSNLLTNERGRFLNLTKDQEQV